MARRPPRPPIVLRIPREAIYAAIVVLFLFTAIEVALRVQHAITDARRGSRPYSIRSVTRSGRPYAHDDGQIELMLEPYVVYGNRPGQKTELVSINRQGFRGPDWRRDKPEGTRRVIVLGGSAAFGVGASGDDKVFTAVLESILDGNARARERGGRVEVWNAGAVGYDSSQELILLATRLVDLAPDVVVFFDGWNDFNASATLPERNFALHHPKFCEVDVLLARQTEPFLELVRRLDLYRSLEGGVIRWLGKRQPRGELGDYTDRSAIAVPRFERNLRTMIRVARSYGAAALVAPQPELFLRRDPPAAELELRRKKEKDGYGDYARAAYPRFVAAARAVAEGENAAFLDCTVAFDAIPDAAFTDCVHFDDGGNALLARYLAPAVERLLLPGAER